MYTLNPKAVWSDGVPITAKDFIYAWEQQRGDLTSDPALVASTAGYRDIKSVTGSNKGRTVTVVFRQPFADWQMLFSNLLPAHIMEKVGWNPSCTTVNPAIDLSAGPFRIAKVSAQTIVLQGQSEMVGNATERAEHHGAHRLEHHAAGQMGAGRLRAGGPARRADACVLDRSDVVAARPERRSACPAPCCSWRWPVARRAS